MSSYDHEAEERRTQGPGYDETDNRSGGYYSTQNRPNPQQEDDGGRAYIMVVDENEYYDPRYQNENPPLRKFQDKSRRLLFVRKVLGLVFLQFLSCTAAISVCQFVPEINKFMGGMYGELIGFGCMILWCALFCAIGCCRVGHGPPSCFNISLFIISTLLLSVYSGAVTARYDLPAILIAAATTLGVVLVLSLITFHSKFDITSKYLYLLGAAVAVVIFSFISSLFLVFIKTDINTKLIISLIVSLLFAILFAAFILYELKLIVGGGKAEYGEDDWLLASIALFYNILQFFMTILRVIGLTR